MSEENDFEDMENALRSALRRTAAPPDFAARVLAGTRASVTFMKPPARAMRPRFWLRRSFTLAMASALAVVAIVPAVVLDHKRREEARGLKAERDLLTALAITKVQLQQAGIKVRRTTRNIP